MIKKHLKALPFLALLVATIALVPVNNIYSQCTIDYDMTVDPPIPPSGEYDAGTTIEICIEVNSVDLDGANWLHGIEFEFPPGWDESSINVINAPDACANGGTWLYFDNLTCSGYNLGPGFYYDVNSGGPEDGNPCNNFGDPCFTNADWQFCFEVTLDPACGGAGNPLDGADVTPGLNIYGDGDTGSWGPVTTCPTNTNPHFPDISFGMNCCDAEVGESPGVIQICENGDICLFDQIIGSPDPGGIWQGPAGWTWDGTDCANFDPTSDPPGEYEYSVFGTGGCINSVSVFMEYTDLGVIQTVAYCDPLPTCLTNLVTNITLPAGGSWFYPDGSPVAGCTVDPAVDPAGEYTYEFYDLSNCFTTATLSLLFSPAGASGCFTPYDYCNDLDNICPLDIMGCNPNGGGQWALFDSNDNFAEFYPNSGVCLDNASIEAELPGNIEDGFYFVYVLGAFPCAPSFDTVMVSYNVPFDPGTFTQTSICVTDPITDMVGLINGTPDPGGVFVNTFTANPVANPIDPSAYSPGDFLQLNYSGGLTGTTCFGENILEITFLPADADAGGDNSIIVCESDPSFNMLDSLTATANGPQGGGTWLENGNPFGGNFFTPGISPAGTYTYTVASSCDSDFATLDIIVVSEPDAGGDGTLDICSNDANVSLTLGLNPPGAGGGTWFDSGSNVIPGGLVDGPTVTDGESYFYVLTNGPCTDSAEVVINLTPAPFAGVLTTTPQAFCESDGPLDLMTLFTTPPSSSNPIFWSGPAGYTPGSPALFDPSSDPAGLYTYTIPDLGCGPASVSINISIETQPNAGIDGTLTACPNDCTPVNLFTELVGATPGGSWTGPSGPMAGIFDPCSDVAGVYTYTVTSAPGGLCSDQATVTVSFETLSDPGTNGTITLCDTDPPINLFTVLGGTPDGGGTWSGPSALPPGDQGTFNPAINTAGLYTYSITDGSCPAVTAQVLVTIAPEPDAGLNTSATVCESFGNVNLFSLLNGTPETGGSWTDIGGNPISDPYDVTGLCSATPMLLTYTVDNGTCSNSADLALTIECPPNAGPDVTENICGNGNPFDLNSILNSGAQTGGTWAGGNIIVLSSANSGVYTYTVAGNVCPDDQADYTLNISDEITITGLVANCEPNQLDYTVTFTINGGTPPYTVDGTPIAGNVFTSSVLSVSGDPTFNFDVDDSSPCPVVVASGFAPNCVCAASASWSTGNLTICEGETADLTLSLVGSGPFTVTYNDGTNPPGVPGLFDGDAIQVSPLTTTTYTLTGVEDANCIGTANGSVTVTVETAPDAGPDIIEDLCGDGTLLNLNTLLDPGADIGGTWSPTSTVTLNSASSGIYVYEVLGNACPDDQANYTLNISDEITITGLSATCELNQLDYTVTFTINGGTQPYTVNGTPIGGSTFTSAVLSVAGDPTFGFNVGDSGPCPDVSVNGTAPNCNCPATASWAVGNLTICEGESADLTLALTGSGPFTVTYNDGTNPPGVPGLFDGDAIQVSPLTTTTYTLTGVEDANCIGTANGSVTVTVESPPNAGPNVTEDLCGDGTLINLNTLLDPGADAGGNWSPTSTVTLNSANSGIYTYEVLGSACPSDDASYTLNISDELTITSQSATCESNQLDYTVTFTISGGTQPYFVDGIALGGNSFTSSVLSVAGDPSYSFSVSDSGPCPDITVDGTAPNCNCPAQGSISGSAELCAGDCTNITFSLTGDGPFDVELSNSGGGSETFTGISDGYVHVVCPNSGVIYTLTSVEDSNCQGTVNGGPVTINVDQPVTVSNIQQVCDGTNQFYTISFEIAGGNGNYLITPQNGSPLGSLNGNIYSANIPTGDGYTYSVTSSGNSCPPVIVDLNAFDCGCATDAGTISSTPLFGCAGECVQAIHFGNEFLDDNDVLQYVLHNGTASTLGGIIDISDDGQFCLNYPEIEPGVVYYINPVAGTADPFGNVDFNDPCLSVNNGVEVTQNTTPTASIAGGDVICPGEEVDLIITFTGNGPWTFQIARDGDNVGGIQISNNDTFTYTTGIPGTYTIESSSDDNCSGLVFGQATIQNYQTPTAIISGDPDICENSGDGPIVNFTGTPPFTFVYSIDGEEQGGALTVNSNSYTIPANVSGTYSLVSLTDANCGGSVQGAVNVNLIAEPSAVISGGGVVCEGNEAVFNIVATGTAPYVINYSVGGFPQDPIISDSPNITFQSGLNGDYVITSVQDANCTGSGESEASLVVNPLPSAELNSSATAFCIGQEVDISLFLEGNPPFNVTYSINGDTVTATGVQSGFVQTLQPNEPVFAEVLFIEDSSTPTCTSEPQSTIFLAPTELPNAPVLFNDTMCTADFSRQIGVTPVQGLQYSWSPESNLTDPNIGNPEFVPPSIPGGQTRDFVYVLTASNGDCVASDTMSIFVDAGPVARFSYTPDPLTTEETVAFFQNGTIGNINTIYYWEFDTLETSNLYEPSFKFPDGVEANYNVSLTATDPLTGCFDTYIERVEVRPELLIFVPTAFTPDNDGLNDLWGPVVTNIDKDDYRLTVLDRWGNIVFETRDPYKKWNGGKGNSEYFVEPGVYIWIIETKELNSLDEITQKGHVTVVR